MGGASLISVGITIVRTKVLAVLLGPAGVGLAGVYGSVTSVVSAVSNMGVGSSGVRQIAEANGSADPERIAHTIIALRRVSLVLGVLGAIGMLAFSAPISLITFDSDEHAGALAILSLTILFGSVSAGQTALIQGLRRIKDLAKLTIWGAALGTVISIPIVWLLGIPGIPLFLVCVSAMAILTSWLYARRVQVARVEQSWRETFSMAKGLFGLGFAFMASGVMSMGTAWLIRLLIVRDLGIEAAGHYQAAWALSSFYVGFVIQAMGRDFYPRLTAVAADNIQVNRLVNEQTEVGLLVAVPGVLATLALAPWVIRVFYSGDFGPAVELLRWQILGVLGRVVSWPMGYIVIAKGASRLFFIVELVASAVNVGFIWLGIRLFGLEGTGIAMFGLYVFHTVFMKIVSRVVSGHSWSKLSAISILGSGAACAAVVASSRFLPEIWALVLNVSVTIAIGLLCLRALVKLLGVPGLRQLPAFLAASRKGSVHE